jgi:hypothetical protein
MLTMLMNRSRMKIVGAFGLFLLFDSWAQAQHTGLFPNLWVRRERQECAQEAPEFRLYRQMYYGVYPTCWRRFPPGWGCVSPDAPDAAKSFRELPLMLPKPESNRSAGDEGDLPRPSGDAGMEAPGEGSPLDNRTPPPDAAPTSPLGEPDANPPKPITPDPNAAPGVGLNGATRSGASTRSNFTRRANLNSRQNRSYANSTRPNTAVNNAVSLASDTTSGDLNNGPVAPALSVDDPMLNSNSGSLPLEQPSQTDANAAAAYGANPAQNQPAVASPQPRRGILGFFSGIGNRFRQ